MGESAFSLLGGDFSEVFVESSSISILSPFSSLSFVFSAALASCWRFDNILGGEGGGEGGGEAGGGENLSKDSDKTSGGCFGGDRGDREELSSMIGSSLTGLSDGEQSGSGLAGVTGFSGSSAIVLSSLAPGSLSEQSNASLVCLGLAQLRFSSLLTSIASSASVSFFSSPFSIGLAVLRGSFAVWHSGGARGSSDCGRGCNVGSCGESGSAFGVILLTSRDSGTGGKLLGEKEDSGKKGEEDEVGGGRTERQDTCLL